MACYWKVLIPVLIGYIVLQAQEDHPVRIVPVTMNDTVTLYCRSETSLFAFIELQNRGTNSTLSSGPSKITNLVETNNVTKSVAELLNGTNEQEVFCRLTTYMYTNGTYIRNPPQDFNFTLFVLGNETDGDMSPSTISTVTRGEGDEGDGAGEGGGSGVSSAVIIGVIVGVIVAMTVVAVVILVVKVWKKNKDTPLSISTDAQNQLHVYECDNVKPSEPVQCTGKDNQAIVVQSSFAGELEVQTSQEPEPYRSEPVAIDVSKGSRSEVHRKPKSSFKLLQDFLESGECTLFKTSTPIADTERSNLRKRHNGRTASVNPDGHGIQVYKHFSISDFFLFGGVVTYPDSDVYEGHNESRYSTAVQATCTSIIRFALPPSSALVCGSRGLGVSSRDRSKAREKDCSFDRTNYHDGCVSIASQAMLMGDRLQQCTPPQMTRELLSVDRVGRGSILVPGKSQFFNKGLLVVGTSHTLCSNFWQFYHTKAAVRGAVHHFCKKDSEKARDKGLVYTKDKLQPQGVVKATFHAPSYITTYTELKSGVPITSEDILCLLTSTRSKRYGKHPLTPPFEYGDLDQEGDIVIM